MHILEKTDIQLGYIPLLDCVAILWAQHKGYFTAQGLNVSLIQEASWASLRDRLAFGFLDAAHCLSAMLPAAATGEDQLGVPLQTPLVLSQNCAFISLSQKLCYDLDITPQQSPEISARKVVNAIKKGQKIQFAHVFKHSNHHYCLRTWLALADTTLVKNLSLSALPPPYMVEAISQQMIDGFCVGEPWNTQAEIQGFSHIIAPSQNIIPKVADKVLAVKQEWGQLYPNSLKALCNAILQAQQELKSLACLDEVWQLLESYHIIQFHCSYDVHVFARHKIEAIIRHLVSDASPKPADFEWILSQMNQWENLELEPQKIQLIAKNCVQN